MTSQNTQLVNSESKILHHHENVTQTLNPIIFEQSRPFLKYSLYEQQIPADPKSPAVIRPERGIQRVDVNLRYYGNCGEKLRGERDLYDDTKYLGIHRGWGLTHAIFPNVDDIP